MDVYAKAVSFLNKKHGNLFGIELYFFDGGSQFASCKGNAVKNSNVFQTDGQYVLGKKITVSFSEKILLENNPSYPVRDDKGNISMEGHRVSFKLAKGVERTYQLGGEIADESMGLITYEVHPFLQKNK